MHLDTWAGVKDTTEEEAVVPSGDVVFIEAAWDALLRCAYTLYKHVAVRCVCGFSVVSLRFGRPGVLLSVSVGNNSQLAFRKFHID